LASEIPCLFLHAIPMPGSGYATIPLWQSSRLMKPFGLSHHFRNSTGLWLLIRCSAMYLYQKAPKSSSFWALQTETRINGATMQLNSVWTVALRAMSPLVWDYINVWANRLLG